MPKTLLLDLQHLSLGAISGKGQCFEGKCTTGQEMTPISAYSLFQEFIWIISTILPLPGLEREKRSACKHSTMGLTILEVRLQKKMCTGPQVGSTASIITEC